MDTTTQLGIAKLLRQVAEYRASALHLSVGNPPILRVDDQLRPLQDEGALTPEKMEKIGLSFLDEEHRAVLQKDKEVVLTYSFEDRARFKVNVFYQKGYLSVSLKYIPPTVPNLRELGLPAITERFTRLKKGLVLVTGPFGSGKSTTLASLIETINQTRSEYIITIEQPVEYVFTNNKSIIEQREVGRDTVSFQKALSSIPQEDVNVVMLSELDDLRVIEFVFTVVESGRLVFLAMNTDSAYKTIEKIINAFDNTKQEQIRLQLADALEGVISQRLLTKVGGGKIAAAEILMPSPAVKSIIKEGSIYQLNTILQTSREEGMISLDRALAELVKAGEVLLEDALYQATDKNGLKMMIRM
ncbi:MAG: PilT/PilU family type 4a pilus ATPase [Patescibacteria group bacterium]|nr:PilT/PilU family type 4a pilus ATPase [Patescibacteria group bacterium]MDD5567215.1 PilT/PilU family type 4a pilus ATPase [Patescibacteria group bacterium]